MDGLIVKDVTRTINLVYIPTPKRSSLEIKRNNLLERYKRGVALRNKIFIILSTTLFLVGAIILMASISYLLRTPGLGYITGFVIGIASIIFYDDMQEVWPTETLYIKNRKNV